ncbi:MAG: propionate--CoA ligase, partial [Pseudomonadota bacterium]|nr:propionate--CoA ligase [Pseudomonadota bacterium]
QVPPTQILDASTPPFARWSVGGQTNLCYNAVDRWAATQPDAPALIAVSSETDQEQTWTYAELLREVECCAAMLQSLGVGKGDRVLVYLPMIAQAMFVMMACARIGAIHSVVFGGFASLSLATRIDDARPTLIVSADAGSRAGKVVAYKPLLDAAIATAQHRPAHVLLVDRGLAPMERCEGRDIDYATLRAQHLGARVPVTWLAATDVSYILYTSGTTGVPKGVQRDVGGYAVALAASMQQIFGARPNGVFFCTSDIGWVVGHSYIIYGPLIAGMATVLYEGLPVRPDAGVWWRIVEKYRVTRMFSAPTAVRVLKKQSEHWFAQSDLSSLEALYLAGEPLDETTSRWIAGMLQVPIIDNYWQTESGWPIMSIATGVDAKPTRIGSPGVPMPGYRVKIIDENTGATCAANQKGVVVIEHPLPPGCLQTIWGDDARFVSTYWSQVGERMAYSTFDWGIRDTDGYYFILGRTDDVINVAGHRLGTREIEETVARHPAVAEVAVVGIADAIKGQAAVAFVTVRENGLIATREGRLQVEQEVMALVDRELGAVARPARVYCVGMLPKTRSGKLLRRSLQALCEGREPGDLTTLEDPASLQQVREVLAQG